MTRHKVRDIYGNWVYEDDESSETSEDHRSGENKNLRKEGKEEILRLDWRDWLALMIASLETILLPIVIFIVVVIVLVAVFFHF